MKKSLSTLLVAVFAALLVNSAFGAEPGKGFKVIVNKSSKVESLTKAEIVKIFKKRQSSWDDGDAVKVFDQAVSSDVRKDFTKAVFGKSAVAMKNYWRQQIFSGRGVPPTILTSDTAVVDAVKQDVNAIGYVGPNADTSGVKVIDVKL